MKIGMVTSFVIAALCCWGSASAETVSDRTGLGGNIVQEARVKSGNQLRGLIILEQADRPCVVQVYGNLAPVKEYEGRIDNCKGGGPTKADGFSENKGEVFIVGGASYVTGLKVCLSDSSRVKGWTIYGRTNSSPNIVSDSFKRPNCPDDGWQSRVDCPTGTKAIGVRTYSEPGTGENSDMLRGMQLICN